MMDEVYLEMYKIYYKDVIMTEHNTLMIKELKKLNENKDNNFIDLFEIHIRKSFDQYKEESLNKEYLGILIEKFFKGEDLTDDEKKQIALSSSKEKLESFELISFKRLKQTNQNKLENFIYNIVDIENIKKSVSFDEFFNKNSFVDDLFNLGQTLFKHFNGEILTDKEIEKIASSSDSDKTSAMIFVSVDFFNLRKDEKQLQNFLKNEDEIEKMKPQPLKIKRKSYPF